MKRTKPVSRRGFLRGAVAAGAALVFPAIVPGRALGKDGTVAPSERLTMCCIGVGGMGSGNMGAFLNKPEVQVVAICDVIRQNRERAKNAVDANNGNKDCQAYLDLFEMLDSRKDLDLASIALPDHWHALAAVACARAGLDIYGEKPLARSIREGRAICDAVKRYGRIWQTGSWQRSSGEFHRGAEIVHAGHLGQVRKVEVGLPTGKVCGVVKPQAVPDGLDWDRWLGPAPWCEYVPFNTRDSVMNDWRWLQDYSGGQLTDWAGHHIDIAHWGLGFDHTGPVKVEPVNVEFPKDGLWNVAVTYRFILTYRDGVQITVANDQQVEHGTRWFGERGSLHVTRGGIQSDPAGIINEPIGSDEPRLYLSRDHHQNFLDCVKTRRETITPAEVAHRSISTALLGEIAMLTGRTLEWDPDREEIRNDPEANALLGRPYRAPYSL